MRHLDRRKRSCVHVRRKCANNRQLIVAGIQRFLLYAYAARFRIVLTRKTLPCATSTYADTDWRIFRIWKQ